MIEVTQILDRIQAGDPTAADQLLPLIYNELRNLATQKIARERPGQTLQATALTALSFSRDGEMLLAGDARGLVRTWHAFRHLPAESLTVATVEAVTGLQLTDDGVVTQLDSKQWLQRFTDWKKFRQTRLATTVDALPRTIEAALEARTPDEWRVVQPGLDRIAERSSGCVARLLRARSKLEAQQPDEASAEVKKAVELGPPTVVKTWLSSLARHEAQQGQRGQASWYLDRMVESDLADADVFLALAELHVVENHRAEANAWLQRAMDAQPISLAVLRSVGEIDFRLRNWEAAAARLTRALELGGGNAKVWKLRAACFAELGRWGEAAEDLGKAVQRHPRISELREHLAIALVSSGNLTSYRELCVETLASLDFVDYAKRPWTLPLHLALAPDGLPDYQTIIRPAQDFADKYADGCVSPQVLGPYCYRSGEYERAASTKLSSRFNQFAKPDAYIFFAMAYAKTGNLAAAKQKLAELEATGWRRSNIWVRQRISLLLAEAEPLISSETTSNDAP